MTAPSINQSTNFKLQQPSSAYSYLDLALVLDLLDICEHENFIDLSSYIDLGAFNDEFPADLFQHSRQQECVAKASSLEYSSNVGVGAGMLGGRFQQGSSGGPLYSYVDKLDPTVVYERLGGGPPLLPGLCPLLIKQEPHEDDKVAALADLYPMPPRGPNAATSSTRWCTGPR
ncbi:CCAAT/enhancer-binding protein alpha-like [Rhineura floridana]|uniref:CCAAT/enhancer-binding protein alpha-like n=1 Tax=Rhineura floridana TaxID=261503 RepID=UPI002AC81865|nr:CCAAT/enhancer-binding protein alpha-like [Rhineura floridana]